MAAKKKRMTGADGMTVDTYARKAEKAMRMHRGTLEGKVIESGVPMSQAPAAANAIKESYMSRLAPIKGKTISPRRHTKAAKARSAAAAELNKKNQKKK